MASKKKPEAQGSRVQSGSDPPVGRTAPPRGVVLLSLDEAARRCNVTRQTVRAWLLPPGHPKNKHNPNFPRPHRHRVTKKQGFYEHELDEYLLSLPEVTNGEKE